ncbi:hypothetical protein M758_11G117600 [Ceratodon purpureus]|nr:hypothetical protein M758_11G117600 [Ceratodon purpureus]
MGKKGKWLTSVKKAFRSPIREGDDEEPEVKDLDLFGDIRPLAVQDKHDKVKQKGRRWSFGKLVPTEEKEPEKRRDDGNHREAVLSNSKFTMYMYPSQEEWAAVVIQTAFRGYLARKSLRALRGLVRLQAFVRGHRVVRQATTTMRSMQALAHVQGRIRAHRVRMSEEGLAVQHQMWQRGQPASRKASDGLTEAGWNDSTASAQQIEAKVQERQVAALKRERALAYARTQQQLRRASPKPVMPLFIECEVEKAHWGWSYMERWASARPWESRIFDNQSAVKDVGDGQVSKSLDVSSTRNAEDTSGDPKQQSGATGRRASLAVTPTPQARASGEFVNAHMRTHGSGGGPRSRQSRAASPRSRCGSDDAEDSGSVAGSASASGTGRSTTSILTDPQFGTRYSNSGPVRNGVIVDTEVKSPPVVAGHLQVTQSVKNKARSASQPRTRPGGSGAGAFKTPATMKRLSYAKSEHGNGSVHALVTTPSVGKQAEDGPVANPRFSGQLGRTGQRPVVSRPKSGVLPGPRQYEM